MKRDDASRRTTYGAWVAARVRRERGERGWSLEATARKMAEVGCPIASTAILKIETGDPPRKITVDEHYAFSRVFGLSLEALAQPPEVSEDEQIAALAVKVRQAQEEMIEPTTRWLTLFEELEEMNRRSKRPDEERETNPADTGTNVFSYLAGLDLPSSRDDRVGPFQIVIKMGK